MHRPSTAALKTDPTPHTTPHQQDGQPPTPIYRSLRYAVLARRVAATAPSAPKAPADSRRAAWPAHVGANGLGLWCTLAHLSMYGWALFGSCVMSRSYWPHESAPKHEWPTDSVRSSMSRLPAQPFHQTSLWKALPCQRRYMTAISSHWMGTDRYPAPSLILRMIPVIAVMSWKGMVWFASCARWLSGVLAKRLLIHVRG
mmetsp:Transcript_26810/g.76935  ORF Transcript_26810/g.76935 Transcript_26810/m.76935 type:complete len:200 (+) Transcript_26810:819-1418(+)